jgi:hypothetical protein
MAIGSEETAEQASVCVSVFRTADVTKRNKNTVKLTK